jgi:hypothetical protein
VTREAKDTRSTGKAAGASARWEAKQGGAAAEPVNAPEAKQGAAAAPADAIAAPTSHDGDQDGPQAIGG